MNLPESLRKESGGQEPKGASHRVTEDRSLLPSIFRHQVWAERCEGLWKERKSHSYKSSKRHVTQQHMIYQVNQGLPEEEVENLNKRWNTYPGTRAITAEHRWMEG